jgi:hypothetical protein
MKNTRNKPAAAREKRVSVEQAFEFELPGNVKDRICKQVRAVALLLEGFTDSDRDVDGTTACGLALVLKLCADDMQHYLRTRGPADEA